MLPIAGASTRGGSRVTGNLVADLDDKEVAVDVRERPPLTAAPSRDPAIIPTNRQASPTCICLAGRALLVLCLAACAGKPTEALPPEDVEASDFAVVIRGIRPRGFAAVPYTRLTPEAGAREHFVSTAGNDANAGTRAAPFRTVNHAAQVAVAGDVVTIRAGEYRESVEVRNSGTAERRIVFQAEQRGAVVFTGGLHTFAPAGWTGGKLTAGPFYVTVRGLIFRDYARVDDLSNTAAAAKAATGWTYEDCLFDAAGRTGLDIRGDSVTVVRSTFQHHYQHAFTAWGPTTGATGPDHPAYIGIRALRILDVVVRGNYTSLETMSPELSSRVAKLLGTRGTVIDNLESYANWGPGLWLDHANAGYIIRNSYFHGNRSRGEGHSPGRGLHLEVNWSPGLVSNNVFFNNDQEAIAINNSQGVEVRRNLMVDHAQCIRLYNGDRGSSFVLRDLNIHSNFCAQWRTLGAIHAWHGAFTTPAQMSIRVEGNTFEPGPGSWLAWWPGVGVIRSLEEMQGRLGWEWTGRLAEIPWPP